MTFTVMLENPPNGFKITGLGESIKLDALQELARPLVVIVPNESYEGSRTLILKIHSEPGDSTVRHEVEFLGPNPHLFHQP
jgi:hypothetical protein